MKIAILLTATLLAIASSGCFEIDSPVIQSRDGTKSSKKTDTAQSQTKFVDAIVETACGQCELGMDGSGCDLAVRIEDHAYFVDGSGIDDHGDAHGDAGLCNCVREAKVTGEIVNDRFVATKFEVLAEDR